MRLDLELSEQEEQPVLYIRTRTALSGLPKVIGNAYGAIINYLTEIGEQPADAPTLKNNFLITVPAPVDYT